MWFPYEATAQNDTDYQKPQGTRWRGSYRRELPLVTGVNLR